MLGNGVDMYDLVREVTDETDIRLTPTNEIIWIGVIEKMSPSPPVPRKRTHSFSRCQVYLHKGQRVFGMINNYKTGSKDFYYIPDEELIFIEKVR